MQLHAPDERVPVHVSVVLAVTVTVPVGVPPVPVTLKLIVTACPVVDGFGELPVIVVVDAVLVLEVTFTVTMSCGAGL
jgi:hypothetical protein